MSTRKIANRLGSGDRVEIETRVEDETSSEEALVDSKRQSTTPDSPQAPWTNAVGAKGDVFYVSRRYPGNIVNRSSSDNSSARRQLSNSERLPEKRKSSTNAPGGSTASESSIAAQSNINSDGHTVNFPAADADGRKSDSPDDISGLSVRTVTLSVDPDRHNYGRRATLCEKLFGIIPGRLKLDQWRGRTLPHLTEKFIIVEGLLPDGEALKSCINIGELITAVDGHEVNVDNVDTILANVTAPRLMTLTLQKVTFQMPAGCVAPELTPTGVDLIELVAGDRLNEQPPLLDSVHHCAFYLTMDVDSEKMADKEDVIYCFPKPSGKLFEVRGAFVTLSQVLYDVTKSEARNTTVYINDERVNIAYHCKHGDKEVFIFGATGNRLSVVELNRATEDIVRIIQLLFGSLKSAFSERDNHASLNRLFALTFQRLLNTESLIEREKKQTKPIERFFNLLPGVRAVSLPPQLKVTVDDCLSDFEAADFGDMSEDHYGLRRCYTIVGCCLFYKGYLITSHLPADDLVDIELYLRYHCLLTWSDEEQLGHVVVWRELFPTRRYRRSPSAEPVMVGFSEPDARIFLLVVGMQNAMLATILEAGGCASSAEGNPTPDPFYVDQAMATLLHLEKLDVFTQCTARIEGPAIPSLSCADWFLPSRGLCKPKTPAAAETAHVSSAAKKHEMSGTRGAKSQTGSLADLHSKSKSGTLQKKLSLEHLSDDEKQQRVVESASMLGLTRCASVDSDEFNPTLGGSRLFKGQKKQRKLLSMFDVTELKKELPEGHDATSVKITSGCANTLFHYVHFDSLDGVFIAPTRQELAHVSSPLTDVVLDRFHTACIRLHEVFERNRKLALSGKPSIMGDINEQGVEFTVPTPDWNDPKKPAPTIAFQVVGRKLDVGRDRRQEFYACFHESADQNTIEMAFKLMQGTSSI